MIQNRIPESLKPIVGKAEGTAARVGKVLAHLNKKGMKFRKAEKTANHQKGETMATLVALQADLHHAKLLKATIKSLRKELGNSSATGPRQKHSGQSFYSLTLEGPYGMRKSTASRWARIINLFVKKKIKPDSYGAEIEKRGGIEGCLEEVPKKERGLKTRKAEKELIHLHINKDAATSFSLLKDGDHAFGGILRKKANKCSLEFVTRDPMICRTLIRLKDTKKGLERTYGVDPRKLNPKIPKLNIEKLRTLNS